MKRLNDADYIKASSYIIECTLEALGILAKVAEISIEKKFYQYSLSIPLGTRLEDLEKYGRDLALNIPSPTGKVYWEIPIIGTSFVGLKVPKPSTKELEEFNKKYNYDNNDKGWRNKIAFIFFMIGKVSYIIANKILGNK